MSDDFSTGIIVGLLIGIPAGVLVLWTVFNFFPQMKTYSNLEEWEFVRNEEGRTLGVRVKRDAKEN